MHVVRTTLQPDKEIEVGDAEYADLKAQGLLIEDQSSEDKQPEKQKSDTGKAGTDK